MALKFSKLGCKMILWDINFISLQLAEQEIKKNGGQVYIYQCDVSERTNIYKVAEKVKNDIGSIDILINNAGVVAGQYFTELKDEQIEKVIKVNTLGPIFVTKAFLNDMIQKNEGHIVTISSAGGISGAPKLTDYCASKFAVFGFNEALRLELKKKKYNIQTTVVCPFYIKTGMFEGAKSGSFLLPLLEPELVANSVIQAVKRNQSELYLPKIVSITYLVKFLFSTKIRDYISDLLGITSSMDDFSGLRKI
jgi:all-trans-retinol dehydrogenase (NAD+)